jgi:hypothetical protein
MDALGERQQNLAHPEGSIGGDRPTKARMNRQRKMVENLKIRKTPTNRAAPVVRAQDRSIIDSPYTLQPRQTAAGRHLNIFRRRVHNFSRSTPSLLNWYMFEF